MNIRQLIMSLKEMDQDWEVIACAVNHPPLPGEEPQIWNLWEKACKEFLKGCTCVDVGRQEDCPECLKAFCDRLRQLAKDEGYQLIDEHVIPIKP